ncbi:two-component system, NarL family, sensor histidine kinase DegS [Alkalicoccus daliensis]|uniref:Signal transduction histidine-protein kinase/phosphatase DegS n=1 Tax=Alkalicoccus daliensis TaxID=745820 RepID=A0A1H0J2D3_9BACI|nr:two-component system, NarL family, sensor histidine kinase DegS [Alkalicoccus daliensis]
MVEKVSGTMSSLESLDQILAGMMETVGKSKEQIFDIGEDSRQEYEGLKDELEIIKEQVVRAIDKSERVRLNSRFARNRLSEVSKHFDSYTDKEVRDAYEQANEFQVQLAVLQQEEKQLRNRRDQIERRLVKLQGTMERADKLINQINVVINYLTGDLKQVSEMLENAEQMQEFGLQIIKAQEEERKRLSREIHDGPAQMMANVALRSEIVERVLDKQGIEQARIEIRDMKEMVKDSLAEVRRIIYDLRPMALDDLGLLPTLGKYLKNVEERTGIIIELRKMGREIRYPSEMEVAIFRFVQEAVNNAVKHADASLIQVKIDVKQDLITAVIKDDGKGFDMTQKKEGSFGLIGMKERINMLDGKINIDSKPGRGTLIIVQIPIDADK